MTAQEAQIVAPVAGPDAPVADPAPTTGDRPEWLPEKFATPEAFAAAYSALEKKQSAAGAEADAGDAAGADDAEAAADDGTPAEDATADDDSEGEDVTPVSYGKAVDTALEAAGLKPGDVNAEYVEKGALSDDTYAKLEAAGFTRAVVDTYVQGFQNQAANANATEAATLAEVKALAGGDENYTQMMQWASTNMSEADRKAYNTVMDSGDVGMIKLAVQGMHAQFVAADGVEPKLLEGGGPGGSSTFGSWKEMETAMTKARASGDPAQIKAVEQKALRSNL